MRRLFIAALTAAAGLVAGAGSVRADSVEVSGVHLCCPRCVSVAAQAVGKVDGVTDAKGDRATKKVTFTAKDEKATKAAQAALTEAGFYGTFKVDGKELPAEAAPAKKDEKLAEVTVTKAHICCGACKTAATKLFTDAKVEFPEGKKDTIKVTGKDLNSADVLEILHKAGFGGKVD
jgi:copper chaperone CopZ